MVSCSTIGNVWISYVLIFQWWNVGASDGCVVIWNPGLYIWWGLERNINQLAVSVQPLQASPMATFDLITDQVWGETLNLFLGCVLSETQGSGHVSHQSWECFWCQGISPQIATFNAKLECVLHQAWLDHHSRSLGLFINGKFVLPADRQSCSLTDSSGEWVLNSQQWFSS